MTGGWESLNARGRACCTRRLESTFLEKVGVLYVLFSTAAGTDQADG